MKTLKNKLCSVALVLCGCVLTFLDNDATALALFGIIACRCSLRKKIGFAEGRPTNGAFPFIFTPILQLLLWKNHAH